MGIMDGGGGTGLTQQGFRHRADDGDETTATWLHALDEDWKEKNTGLDTNLRVRFHVRQTVGISESSNLTLRYSHNGGTYTRCNASSSVIQMSASPNFTNATDCTQQITSAPTFLGNNQGMEEDDGQTNNPLIVFAVGTRTEVEMCFQIIGADVSAGDIIQLRQYRTSDTETLGSYPTTPTITIDRRRIFIS